MSENNRIRTVLERFTRSMSFDNKNEALALLMALKECPEFSGPIDWTTLCKDMGRIYKDPTPFYSGTVFTPDPIDRKKMGASDIFVFGSNTEGAHGGGAARVAVVDYDAVYGQARGLQGRSYAIVTKDLKIGERSVPTSDIEAEIDQFLQFAFDNQQLTFWVTKLGCGLGGFTIQDIGPLFSNKVIPQNVMLPIEFVYVKFWMEYTYSPSKNKFYRIKDEKIVVIDCDLLSLTPQKFNLAAFPEDIRVATPQDWADAVKMVMNNIVDASGSVTA